MDITHGTGMDKSNLRQTNSSRYFLQQLREREKSDRDFVRILNPGGLTLSVKSGKYSYSNQIVSTFLAQISRGFGHYLDITIGTGTDESNLRQTNLSRYFLQQLVAREK